MGVKPAQDTLDQGRGWPRRFDIEGGKGEVYLTRWTLVELFGWALMLHCIRRPDADRCLHDHPWRFWTLVLWGGYVERVPGDRLHAYLAGQPITIPRWVRPLTLNYRPAEYRHQITSLPRGRAWTLVLRGPRTRRWGFWSAGRWMYWREFVTAPLGERAAWCEERQERP